MPSQHPDIQDAVNCDTPALAAATDRDAPAAAVANCAAATATPAVQPAAAHPAACKPLSPSSCLAEPSRRQPDGSLPKHLADAGTADDPSSIRTDGGSTTAALYFPINKAPEPGQAGARREPGHFVDSRAGRGRCRSGQSDAKPADAVSHQRQPEYATLPAWSLPLHAAADKSEGTEHWTTAAAAARQLFYLFSGLE